MTQKVALFWFRRDLRLDDNAGLTKALGTGLPVVPFFIFDTEILSQLEDKDDKRVSFIYAALMQMQETLAQNGTTLDIRFGAPMEVIDQLLLSYRVEAVYANHDYEPYATQRDNAVKTKLAAQGVRFVTTKDQVIFEKAEVVKDDGTAYSMFTPYSKKWKALLKKTDPNSYPAINRQSNFYQQAALPIPSLDQIGFVFNKNIISIPSVDQ
ncbi:MAG TPA: deoxyribodipyrimidine photo-lyase, partial [Flavisolibacter sp.]|nr:deoxyribodipyrimidine photo-lyase [Flavisolibacter sp.]